MEPNTSAGSVATRARCSGILNNHFTASLLENLSVQNLKIC